MGVGELGLRRGDEEVAHQGELETSGDREPVDGTDDGLVYRSHGRAEVARRGGGRRVHLAAELLEIQTDGKRTSRAGEDHHLDVGRRGDLSEDLGDAVAQRSGQGIQGFGPVQRDRSDRAGSFDENKIC